MLSALARRASPRGVPVAVEDAPQRRTSASPFVMPQSAEAFALRHRQTAIWAGLILFVIVLISYNTSHMHVRSSGLGSARTAGSVASKGFSNLASGGRILTAAAQQGSSQCVSTYKVPPDTPTAQCQAFCNVKFKKFHCAWCKCRACEFCPKGGEAIEEASKEASPPSIPPHAASFAHEDLEPSPPNSPPSPPYSPPSSDAENATSSSEDAAIMDIADAPTEGGPSAEPVDSEVAESAPSDGVKSAITDSSTAPAANVTTVATTATVATTSPSAVAAPGVTGAATAVSAASAIALATGATAAQTAVPVSSKPAADRIAELEAALAAAKATTAQPLATQPMATQQTPLAVPLPSAQQPSTAPQSTAAVALPLSAATVPATAHATAATTVVGPAAGATLQSGASQQPPADDLAEDSEPLAEEPLAEEPLGPGEQVVA